MIDISAPFALDEEVDRRAVPALKVHPRVLGAEGGGLFAAGVADMDFKAPPAVLEALRRRLDHGVFGYEAVPDSLLPALTRWLKRRHGWEVDEGHILRAPNILNALAIAATAAIGLTTAHAGLTDGMKSGDPGFKSIGALAFGPDGILFAADPKGAQVVAIDTGDKKAADLKDSFKIEGIDAKVAGLLGTKADDILINDLAVNPASHAVFLSVSRGRGPGQSTAEAARSSAGPSGAAMR